MGGGGTGYRGRRVLDGGAGGVVWVRLLRERSSVAEGILEGDTCGAVGCDVLFPCILTVVYKTSIEKSWLPATASTCLHSRADAHL